MIRTKKIACVVFFAVLQVPFLFAQKQNVSFSGEKMAVRDAFKAIEQQTGMTVAYNETLLDVDKQIAPSGEKTVSEAMEDILKGTGMSYSFQGKMILVVKEENTPSREAKPITVSGKVTDEAGEPLIGAAIMVEGTLNGVITDLDGKYSIKAKTTDNLKYTSLGYETVVLKAASRNTALVVLKNESQVLEGVVVTALGIKRDEKSIGYSAVKVGGEQFSNQVTTSNWLNGISGQVAGLNIDRSNSGPNGSMRVTIRGESTADLSNNGALFVVDGVPMYNNSTTSDAGGEGSTFAIDYGDGTSDIDPDNIENVTVLKGAAATALYGSAAANGAIIITTKSSENQESKLKVSYKFSFAADKVLNSPDLQYEYGQGTTQDYYYYLKSDDAEKGSGYNPLGKATTASMTSWGPKMDGTQYYQYYNDKLGIGGYTDQYGDFQRTASAFTSYGDWFRDYFQTGTTFNNSLVLSGKINDKNSIRVSLSDKRGEGITPNTPFQQQFLSVKANNSLAKWLTLETVVNYKRTKNDNIPTSSGYGSTAIMYSLWCYAPNVDMNWVKNYWKDEENKLQDTSLSGGKNNAYFLAYECINNQDRDRLYGNLKFDADIYKDLTLMVRGGIDLISDFRTQRQGYSTQANPTGWYREQDIDSKQYYGDFLFKYNHNWNEFNLTANLGGSMLYRQYSRHVQTANSLKLPGVYSMANSLNDPKVDNYSEMQQTNSLYGLVSLSWKNAIFLDITGRNDWSSTLPKGHNSYFYPSVSGSVVLNDLFDFGRTNGLINLMKLRASWAQVGHDTAPYRTEEYLSTTGFAGTVAIQSTKTNTDLKPEMVSSWEVGFELRMFKNRLSFDIAYYDAITRDLISKMPISYATGVGSVYVNAGSIRNNGLEISLSGTLIKSRDFSWKLGGNWTRNVNTVLELGEGIDSWIVASYSTHAYMTAYAGGSLTSMYGKGYKRAPEGSVAIDAAGNMVDVSGMMLLDKQNMPQVDTELKYLGDVAPQWKAGLNTTFKWKDLSLYVSFDGQYGGHVYSYTNWVLNYRGKGTATLAGRDGSMVPEGVRVTSDGNYVINTEPISKENISNYYQCLYDNTNAESNFVETSFIKLREISLTYSLPKKLLAKTKVISGVDFTVYGNNLYCWSKFPGWDPEGVSIRGSSVVPGFEILQMPSGTQFGGSVGIRF